MHCYLGKSLTADFTIMLSFFKSVFLGCTGPNSWVAFAAATFKNAPQCTPKYCALEARKKPPESEADSGFSEIKEWKASTVVMSF